MALGNTAADRVERFLGAHPGGRLVVCMGSASGVADRGRRGSAAPSRATLARTCMTLHT